MDLGLVVDDAIIVVENADRHLEQGHLPISAAIQGARELGRPIVATTVVLRWRRTLSSNRVSYVGMAKRKISPSRPELHPTRFSDSRRPAVAARRSWSSWCSPLNRQAGGCSPHRRKSQTIVGWPMKSSALVVGERYQSATTGAATSPPIFRAKPQLVRQREPVSRAVLHFVLQWFLTTTLLCAESGRWCQICIAYYLTAHLANANSGLPVLTVSQSWTSIHCSGILSICH